MLDDDKKHGRRRGDPDDRPHSEKRGLTAWIHERLSLAPKLEVEQAMLRFRRTIYFSAYGVVLGYVAEVDVTLWVYYAASYIVLSAALFLWLYWAPRAEGAHLHFRRVLYMAGDHALPTYGMYVYGGWATILYCVYPLVNVGNAARYGGPYQWISIALSVVGWLIVINFTDDWQTPIMQPVGYALLLNLLLTPVYSHMFVQRLRAANEKLEELATHDALTGLPNRPYLYRRLEEAIALAERNQKGLVVMSMDLDDFKRINDAHGHEAGDGALRAAAVAVRSTVRRSDTVARLGGDEFVIVLRDVATERPQDLGDNIREALRHYTEQSLSASIGIAVYPRCGTDAETLVRHADQAMYEAKRAGKARTMLCPQCRNARRRAV